MKASFCTALYDVICIFRLRMKLIRKDYITLVVLLTSVILFTLLVRSLIVASEELSSLPVGIVDKDNSEASKNLIFRLQKMETLRMIEKSDKELQKLLMDDMITSIFIIEEGYEKKLKAGNPNRILTMKYREDNKSASILADIIAGEIIYPLCLYKSYHYYDRLSQEEEQLTLIQYQSYMEELLGSNKDFDFAFQLNYYNPQEDTAADANISNSVLYQQFIFGILGMMMSFIAMFLLSLTVREKENGIDSRLTISGFHSLKRDLGNLCALLVWEGFLSLIFTVLIFNQLHLGDYRLWLSAYLLLLLNALVLGGAMLLISKLIKRMLAYQLLCSGLILLAGGLGFYQLISGFHQGFISIVVKFIPNSWFIKGFTDIIIYGSQQGFVKEGHTVLILMTMLLIFLVIGIDLIRDYRIMKASNKRTGW